MNKKIYETILSEYRQGAEMLLVTNRGNENLPSLVYIDYPLGKKTALLRFAEGGEVFKPESVGGIEKGVISLTPLD